MPTTVDLGVSGLEVRTGDHICALYRGAERDDILVPFLEAGLRTAMSSRRSRAESTGSSARRAR
jgi:hypothetical protein